MNKKIIAICLLSMFLLSSINGVSKSIAKEELRKNLVSTNNEDLELTITLKYLEMLDYIDYEIWRPDPSNKYADFYYRIWVYGGIDSDGDNYWEPHLPDDIIYDDNVGKKHTWNVGDKTEVNIKVELKDRDPLNPFDEMCDINGASIEKKDVEFTYILTGQHPKYNLKGTGGDVVCDKAQFIGEDDGTYEDGPREDDDNDAWMSLRIDDNYRKPAEIEFWSLNGWDFGEVTEGKESESRYFYLHNTGDYPVRGTLSYSGDLGDFTIVNGGTEFELQPRDGDGNPGSQQFHVKFTPQSTGTKILTIHADAENPCNDASCSLQGTGKEEKSKSIHDFFLFSNLIKKYPLLGIIVDFI